MPPYPEEIRYLQLEINDSGHTVCLEYQLVDPVKLILQHTGRVFPMEACIGVLGLKIENQVKMNDWVRDVRDWGEANCDANDRDETNYYRPGESPR